MLVCIVRVGVVGAYRVNMYKLIQRLSRNRVPKKNSPAPGSETGSRERIVAIHFDADTHRFAVQNHAIQNFLDFLCTSTGEASRV